MISQHIPVFTLFSFVHRSFVNTVGLVCLGKFSILRVKAQINLIVSVAGPIVHAIAISSLAHDIDVVLVLLSVIVKVPLLGLTILKYFVMVFLLEHGQILLFSSHLVVWDGTVAILHGGLWFSGKHVVARLNHILSWGKRRHVSSNHRCVICLLGQALANPGVLNRALT